MGRILPFLIVLLAVAFFTKVDFFFYLLYTLFGTYVLSRFWAQRSLRAVTVERHHDHRVFLGQTLEVHVWVQNRGWLPVLWMRLSDTVPSDLAGGPAFRRVISLLPRERQDYGYALTGRRRGYYPLGPLVGFGGDLLGTATYESHQAGDDFVIVYPKIIALNELGFPSQSPFGNLPHRERLFEDPSRIRGVRDYQPGDSLRRMDWKTSARVGSLQVRRFEPAIALETGIFLNLDLEDYPLDRRYEAPELGIIVAASVAVHLVEKRQAVSLVTNGQDPLSALAGAIPTVPLRKGREHLMHVLDLLARIEVARREEDTVPFQQVLSQRSLGLSWGSTVLVVTPTEEEGLLDTLLSLRRRGLVITLVLTCPYRGFDGTVQRAGQIGIQALQILGERDLDVWR
ncbi:MAG: DUF58 domain-containing protein [Anaerolineae bacterium]